MKFTDRLFEENKKLWNAYLEHPFIKGIEDGSLDVESFRYYMLQDYLYLLDYTKVFAIGISKTRDTFDVNNLSKSISAIAWEVDNVHMKYMKRIGITDDEIRNAKHSITNLGYTSYMIARAYENDIINAYIAVLSCSWSYAYIADKLVGINPKLKESNLYGEWIDAYSSNEYKDANNSLLEIVNNKCKDLSDKRLEELSEIFKVCSIFEMRFWDMAYTKGESDILRF